MNIIIPDKLGDWRLEAFRILRGDQVLPSGYRAKDGEQMIKTSVTQEKSLGTVSFPTPQPVSLLLDAALSSSINGRSLRKQVSFPRVMADGSRHAEGPQVPFLYEYFEACMVSCVFAYFSVEVFANQAIWEKIDKPIELQRRNEKKRKSFGPVELQRRLSTEEKLELVLPRAFGRKVKMPSDSWAAFSRLKEIRDSVVHLKSQDHYVRWKADTETVYYTFLNTDPVMYPEAAIQVMRYFVDKGKMRWLDAAQDYLEGARTA